VFQNQEMSMNSTSYNYNLSVNVTTSPTEYYYDSALVAYEAKVAGIITGSVYLLIASIALACYIRIVFVSFYLSDWNNNSYIIS
jgi:hypothetical protein